MPGAVPLPLAQGLLAAELGMYLQVALGWRRHLLLHAAVVERNGRALVLTGESGAGKSTLAAMMMRAGWRLLGDEFALVGLDDGLLHPLINRGRLIAHCRRQLCQCRMLNHLLFLMLKVP